VTCDMTTLGGGWTQLTSAYADSVGGDTASSKQYLYSFGGRWYVSPVTTASWSWTVGQELTGSYEYTSAGADGGASSFACAGSAEKPPFGIGCSSGSGGTLKVLPWVNPNPSAGTCTVCQDLPNALGGPVCQPGVAILVRAVPTSTTDGGADGVHFDAGTGDVRDGSRDNPAGCVPPPSGVIGWWPGDGNASDPVGGRTGVLSGAATFTPTSGGKVAQAFSFAAPGDMVQVPHAPALDLEALGGATFEGWFRSGTNAAGAVIVGKHTCGVTAGWFFNTAQGCFIGNHHIAGQGLGRPGVDDGQFHHFACVKDGTGYREYVDGVLLASDTGPAVGTSTSAPLQMGGINTGSCAGGTHQLSGVVDEVTVYGRALTTAEILSIYEAGSAGKCK